MITIVHNQDGVEVQAFKSDRKICDPRVRDHVSYVTGVNQPNYPVPAVILHTYIGQEYVQVYEYSRFHCEPYETTYNRLVYSKWRYAQ